MPGPATRSRQAPAQRPAEPDPGADWSSWPANAVERRPIGDLIPYAGNARTHSGEQVAQLAASIREWGWTIPVLVDERGEIIAGHGRVLAAKSLGIAEVPVMVARGWSEAKRRAYVLADNKLALNAGWDDDLLAAELKALQGADFALDLTGFSDGDVAALFAKGAERHTDPDDAPEPPTVAVSVLGDCWVLGDHRIRCGDSTSAADVEALLGSEKPHLMVTDPPYGVEYDADWRNKAIRADGSPSDGRAIGKVLNDGKADWRDAWALFPGAVAYVWHADRHASAVQASMEAAGFEMRCQIIWAKARFAIGRGDYHWQHEPCWYAVRKGSNGNWCGDRKQTTLWEISHSKSETGHSTQKPVECMRRPIENNSQPADAVYEPFSGSGTTLIAAEMTGRRCFAMELNPPYVDVAVRRWQDFTGRAATLAGDGRTFAEIEEARRQASAA